jgi:hypothetical protein
VARIVAKIKKAVKAVEALVKYAEKNQVEERNRAVGVYIP